MARHGRNLGRDSSGTNIDTWRAPREMQGTRRNTYHLWDSCAPPCVKKAQCAGGSRQTGPGGATAPVLQQAHKSELSFCFLPYQNATQQRRRTRRQRTERREPWQGTLQNLFCNARQTEGGSATTCSVAAHKQHKILCFPDLHAREPRQGQSFPYRFQGSCHHLAPTTLHRPSTTSGRTAAIWQRRQQRMK